MYIIPGHISEYWKRCVHLAYLNLFPFFLLAYDKNSIGVKWDFALDDLYNMLTFFCCLVWWIKTPSITIHGINNNIITTYARNMFLFLYIDRYIYKYTLVSKIVYRIYINHISCIWYPGILSRKIMENWLNLNFLNHRLVEKMALDVVIMCDAG